MDAQPRVTVGLDVGGTKLAAGRVRASDGELLSQAVRPTRPERGPGEVLADCVDLVASLVAPGDAGIGVGVPELVSREGRITSAETLAWGGLDVAGAFAHLGAAVVESDVRAGALAEARYGAGRGAGSFLYVSVGTGVSCAFVLGGDPWPGARGNAIIVGGRRLEKLWSGGGLSERLGTADLAAVLATPAGDEAWAIVAEAADALGETLGTVVNALDPERVVVGGGLGLNDAYRGLVEAALRRDLFAEDTSRLPVVPAALGPAAGVVGAALRAHEALP